MNLPKAYYNIAPQNGGYVVVRSVNGKAEIITAEDTLPHALAKLNLIIKEDQAYNEALKKAIKEANQNNAFNYKLGYWLIIRKKP